MPNDYHRSGPEQVLTVTATASVSSYFTLKAWATFVGAHFPDMDDNADVGMEYSRDGGSNYVPILDPVDGDDYLTVKSASDPGWIDISDFIRAIPRSKNGDTTHRLRFTFSVAQDPGITIYVNENS